ncbi:MAG TPA: hypothetical protein VHS96_13645 [Bacteroidia bacterium]|nr:hypothetical protein [Bacteroidia bacterium]
MKLRLGFVLLAVAFGALNFGFMVGGNQSPDLSTPQKSFAAFVDILKTGNASALDKVATPTGQVSLDALSESADFNEGLAELGKDLEASKPKWEEITEDIYFVSASVGDKVHKMEFTKEEPGWMLYHWQIGGGAHEGENQPEPGDW